MKRRLQLLLVAASVSVPAYASAAADAASSLGACQTTVAGQTAKYVRSVTRIVSMCVGGVATAVVEGTPLSAAAEANAAACASKLRKLRNTSDPQAQLDMRLRAKIASACDPTVNPALLHADTDIWSIGGDTLSAARLTEYCMRAGGPTSIGSLEDWNRCLLAVSDCQARQAIALRWPRALEYLEALRTALAGMPPTPATSDAVSVLADIEDALEGTRDDNVADLRCAPSTGLTSTGQKLCDQDDGTFGACPGPEEGQDGEVQAGIPARFTDNGDGTVTDHATGLMWSQSSFDGTIWDATQTYGGWTDSLRLLRQGGLGSLNGLAGYDDWRLPNRRELQSIVDLGRHDPAIDPVFHHDCTPGCTLAECACTTSALYWTSTHLEESSQSWAVSFADGSVVTAPRSSSLLLRGVRGGTPDYAFPPGRPVADTIDIEAPWKQSCVPFQFLGSDLDGRCQRGLRIVSYPQNGFITQFVSGAATPLVPRVDSEGCPTGDDPVTAPPGAEWEMTLAASSRYTYNATFCYVPFSSTFTGTDSLVWEMLDWEGNVSEPALVRFLIFETD